jgi:hypothetical protein
VVGDASVGSDTLLSIESVRGTHFNDTYNATGFTTVPTIALPNAGSAGAINTGAALNEFEGLGGDDIITGNGNTRIAYINATSGVTVDLNSERRPATPRSAMTRSPVGSIPSSALALLTHYMGPAILPRSRRRSSMAAPVTTRWLAVVASIWRSIMPTSGRGLASPSTWRRVP